MSFYRFDIISNLLLSFRVLNLPNQLTVKSKRALLNLISNIQSLLSVQKAWNWSIQWDDNYCFAFFHAPLCGRFPIKHTFQTQSPLACPVAHKKHICCDTNTDTALKVKHTHRLTPSLENLPVFAVSACSACFACVIIGIFASLSVCGPHIFIFGRFPLNGFAWFEKNSELGCLPRLPLWGADSYLRWAAPSCSRCNKQVASSTTSKPCRSRF